MINLEVVFIHGAGSVIPAPDPWPITDTKETCRIYYIHSGHAIFHPEDECVDLFPEQFCFFPPNLPFSIKNDPRNPLVHTYFDFIMTPPIVLDHCIIIDTNTVPALKHLIDAVNTLMVQGQTYFSQIDTLPAIMKCLNAMLSVMSTVVLDIPYITDPVIISALEFIHSHYQEGIGAGDVAHLLGYHEDYFINKFKQAMKITPYAYIKSIRLHEAERLRSMGLEYRRISQIVGYSDASALCHALNRRGGKK